MTAPANPHATTMMQGAARAVNLGAWCVQRGLVTQARIDECLSHQRTIQESGRQAPRLGQILLERGWLKPEDLLRALAGQRRELRHCPRCRFQSTVPLGAGQYVCAACNTPLVPSPDSPVDAPQELFVGPAREPVPDEVVAASRTPAGRFGKYVLVRELGSGGVGRVFLAWDTFLSEFVAVKRLRRDLEGRTPEDLEERRRMLLQEARCAIRLRHPGIVRVYDVGRINDDPYISMEAVEGETLHERIQKVLRSGPIPPFFKDPESILGLLAEVARALDYAHTAHTPLIHCDLKPANIMIDPDGHARILDFGLARNLKSDPAEQAEFISGTPAYMSPEQAMGDVGRMDARTDVYAFGAILYECLTGRTPFVGSSFEILHLARTAVPERPGAALAASGLRVPAALESLCMACLERDPDRRPFSLEDVATTLDALAAEPEPPVPPEPEPSPDLSSLSPRPSRRWPRFIPGVIVLALLGLGLLLLILRHPAGGPRPERAPNEVLR